jgi:cytochrome c oxidase subunit 3
VTATTVTSTERVATKKAVPGTGRRRTGGNGHPPPKPPRGGGGGGGESERERFAPEKYRLAMWAALAAIMMMFTAMAASYIVIASMEDWRSIPLPKQLWLSTALILASSFTFKAAHKFLKQGRDEKYIRWLSVTLALGLAFLCSQLLAWRPLIAQGVYLAGNSRSFFYVLTGVHGLHLLGGIMALSYLLLRTRRRPQGDDEAVLRRETTAGVVGVYWHFMDGLWVFLFLLLLLWR